MREMNFCAECRQCLVTLDTKVCLVCESHTSVPADSSAPLIIGSPSSSRSSSPFSIPAILFRPPKYSEGNFKEEIIDSERHVSFNYPATPAKKQTAIWYDLEGDAKKVRDTNIRLLRAGDYSRVRQPLVRKVSRGTIASGYLSMNCSNYVDRSVETPSFVLQHGRTEYSDRFSGTQYKNPLFAKKNPYLVEGVGGKEHLTNRSMLTPMDLVNSCESVSYGSKNRVTEVKTVSNVPFNLVDNDSGFGESTDNASLRANVQQTGHNRISHSALPTLRPHSTGHAKPNGSHTYAPRVLVPCKRDHSLTASVAVSSRVTSLGRNSGSDSELSRTTK